MVGLIDRLKRNRALAFVLALTLACAMALPTLGFANEEAAEQVAAQAEAGIADSTDFDETVGQEKVVTTEEPVSTGIETPLSPLAEANFATWTGSGTLSWTADVNVEDLDRLYGYYDGEPTLTLERDVAFTTSYDGAKTTITLKESWLKTLENGNYSIDSEELEVGVMPGYAFVIADPDNAKEIISVSVGDSSTDYIHHSEYGPWGVREVFAVYVAGLTDKSSIEPEIEYEGASISPEGPQDFSDPENPSVVYTVTAKDGSSKEYRVYAYRTPLLTDIVFERTGLTKTTVSFTSDCAGDIRITLPRSLGDGFWPPITESTTCVAGKNTIEFEFSPDIYDPEAENYQAYPEFEDLSASIPALVWVEGEVEPANGGTEWTRKEATIPAWKEPVLSSDKEIKSFSVNGVDARIDPFPGDSDLRYSVTLYLPYGSVDLTSVEPLIEISEGATINPAGPQNFRNDGVVYIVTAEDGTTREYHATVSFDWLIDSFDDWSGKGTTSAVVDVPLYKFGSQLLDASDEIPFDLMPALVRGQDYTVHGEGSTTVVTLTESYLKTLKPGEYGFATSLSDGGSLWLKLTVTESTPSSDKSITSVKVGDAEGVIDGTDITVLLPVDIDVTAVTPTIVHTGKSISPTTPQDFSKGPVAYTVTAEDGTTEIYSVSILAILIHATDAGTYTGSETKTSTVNAPVADFVTLHRITPDASVELTLGEDYTVSAAPTAEALSTLAGESTGSTLITFTESYLSTLSEGTYDYVATYKQGVAPFTMTVELAAVEPAPEKPATGGDTATPTDPGDTTSVPKTGDGAFAMLLAAALLALGGTSLVVASGRRRAGDTCDSTAPFP